MSPMLVDQDILLVTLAKPDNLNCGDIVVRWNQQLVSHRVISIDNSRIFTKGDSRYWLDSNYHAADIIGKVRGIVRTGQRVDMDSIRWRIINRAIGYIGWIQVKCAWHEQLSRKSPGGSKWLHRLHYWVGQRLNWMILFILAGSWLRHKYGLESNDTVKSHHAENTGSNQ
jgi:hypothetical protein